MRSQQCNNAGTMINQESTLRLLEESSPNFTSTLQLNSFSSVSV